MLRPATAADKDAIRTWRNHPQVRAVSLTQDEISPQQHESWWAAKQDDPTTQILIYEHGGVPSGVVTFFDLTPPDQTPRTAMWGYYLDNDGLEATGGLLPAWMKIQREAVKYADTQLRIDVLDGEVLDSNEPVRRMNARNGFTEIDQQVRQINGREVTVHHIRRTRPVDAPDGRETQSPSQQEAQA